MFTYFQAAAQGAHAAARAPHDRGRLRLRSAPPLAAPGVRHELHARNTGQRVRVCLEELHRREQAEEATATGRALDPGKVLEQEDAPALGPLVLRTTRATGIERVDASSRVRGA